ncbi:hypothetical protein E4U43_001743 [Claviceps pusilla]|uniref:Uncharacterized protein n=1 Tax=Claviceps pusilla TaxID=123648 RepID=A0A9P7N8G9_9HYPO|nr:hypothetical protein E4U43_001743 [Claviceps pusilla]
MSHRRVVATASAPQFRIRIRIRILPKHLCHSPSMTLLLSIHDEGFRAQLREEHDMDESSLK